MRYGSKLTSLIILFLIFACVTLVLLPESHHDALPPITKNNSPDWFMYNASVEKTNEEGKIQGKVQSPRLYHYEKENRIAMQHPFFTLFDKDNLPWQISADKGNVYQNHPERIDLNSHVIVRQLPGKGSNEVTVVSDSLSYYPDTSEAKTSDPVTITQPGMIIHAIGLEANLKQSIINFLKQSQVEYHEQHNAPTKH